MADRKTLRQMARTWEIEAKGIEDATRYVLTFDDLPAHIRKCVHAYRERAWALHGCTVTLQAAIKPKPRKTRKARHAR